MSINPLPSTEEIEVGKSTQISFSQETEPFPSAPFENKLVYLRKAYVIFFFENLIVTFAAFISAFTPAFQSFQINNPVMPVLFIVFLIAIPFPTMFCPKNMKTIPNNYILIICFTVSSSYVVSYIGAISDPWLILLENETTTLMLFGIVILLTFLKTNYTIKHGLIVVTGISLLSFICGLIFKYSFAIVLVNLLIDIAFGVYYAYQILLCINERPFLYVQNEIVYGSFLPYTDLFFFPLKLCKLDKFTRMA